MLGCIVNDLLNSLVESFISDFLLGQSQMDPHHITIFLYTFHIYRAECMIMNAIQARENNYNLHDIVMDSIGYIQELADFGKGLVVAMPLHCI